MKWIAAIALLLVASGIAHAQTNPDDLDWPAFEGVYVLTHDDEFVELPVFRTSILWPSDHYGTGRVTHYIPEIDIPTSIPTSVFRGIFINGMHRRAGTRSNYMYTGLRNGQRVYALRLTSNFRWEDDFRQMEFSYDSIYVEPRFLASPPAQGLFGYWSVNGGGEVRLWAFPLVDD